MGSVGARAKAGRAALAGLLRAYAAILFLDRPAAGAIVLAGTFVYPNTALAGLWGALAGMLTAALVRFPALESGLHIYNSLLVGLALGAYYEINGYLLLLIALAASLAVFASAAIADVLWRLDHLPALSLPFVIVALAATLAAHSYGTLAHYLAPLAPRPEFVSPWADAFLTALGSAYFTPHPLAGLFMLVAILLVSRHLAFLALCGFFAGYGIYHLLSGTSHPQLSVWNGFNFALTAMAIGGVFVVPSRASFVLALLGAMLAAMVASAAQTFMLVYGLPVMALPFLSVVFVMLAALRRRPPSPQLQPILEAPALPEQSAERARIARVRLGEFGSVPLAPPFHGRWRVYQGFDGEHTHRGDWRHALDFHITENERSYAGDGRRLEDYFCYGLPVLAPAEGVVARALDALPDVPPGEADTRHNWGNHLLIRTDAGLHVLLAHLKQGSLRVREGERVRVGQVVAACGSSGRSPQPHVHLHVQRGPLLGEPTIPFHLAAVVLERGKESEFRLHLRPRKGDWVRAAETDPQLAEALAVRVGRVWCYAGRWRGRPLRRCITSELTLAGELRLVSGRGASIAIASDGRVFALHDRTGGDDPLLDALALALGLTPLVRGELIWRDAPSWRLFPMSGWMRAGIGWLRPLGGGLDARYQRRREGGGWVQESEHMFRWWGMQRQAHVRAWLEPGLGCTRLEVHRGNTLWLEAELEEIGQRADAGVPAWRRRVATTPNEEVHA